MVKILVALIIFLPGVLHAGMIRGSGGGGATYTEKESIGQTGANTTGAGNTADRMFVGAEWVAGDTYTLDRITLRLGATGTLTSGRSYSISIREWDTTNEAPKDTNISSVSTLVGDVVDAGKLADYVIDFVSGASISSGTHYCVVIGLTTGTANTTNFLMVYYLSTGTETVCRDTNGVQNAGTPYWDINTDTSATARIITYDKD
jgi:hypothetical protein